MSSKKKQEIAKEQKDWESIGEAVVTSERFIEKHQKQIFIGVIAILVIVGLVWAYDALYVKPKTEEAQVAMFKGESYFRANQDTLALYGDGRDFIGFEAIAEEYGSTKAGNLAKYYAGVSNFRIGKYAEAISFLNSYNGDDVVVAYVAKGIIGSCYVNTGKLEEGAKFFIEAAKGANDNLISPNYYMKAVSVYRDLKNYDKVIELGNIIRNQYMNSYEAMNIVKYIDEAQVLKGAQ
ncbi:hypothetical protein D0T53_08405 [Dysgonomonas sp. 216]|uniref:tetratricopeptide repeat protein n=1 Tax=Dysgonomonas sp. 216 TaxID=2302934 RepID=UPI0013D678F8|nr:hypothetical protein [Dysgonomonas sp. 216]NDW18934.1 hypothetical protein [Dysgonomonas sp. 216]